MISTNILTDHTSTGESLVNGFEADVADNDVDMRIIESEYYKSSTSIDHHTMSDVPSQDTTAHHLNPPELATDVTHVPNHMDSNDSIAKMPNELDRIDKVMSVDTYMVRYVSISCHINNYNNVHIYIR